MDSDAETGNNTKRSYIFFDLFCKIILQYFHQDVYTDAIYQSYWLVLVYICMCVCAYVFMWCNFITWVGSCIYYYSPDTKEFHHCKDPSVGILQVFPHSSTYTICKSLQSPICSPFLTFVISKWNHSILYHLGLTFFHSP